MKNNKNLILYLVGFSSLFLFVVGFIRLILNINNSGEFLRMFPSILCYIGALIFILSRVLGFFPVSFNKKILFDEIIDGLFYKTDKKDSYKIPDDLYERLKENIRDEEVLTLIARDIVSYCGVDGKDLKVKVKNELVHAAGTFNRNTNEITISLINTRYIDEVLAVLIHECMHFVLRQNGISYTDTLKNEYLTDIACIYFGFGEYINVAYIMIGYLKRNEIKYVKKKISERNY